MCPSCRTAYAGLRLVVELGAYYVLCPACGKVPYAAAFPRSTPAVRALLDRATIRPKRRRGHVRHSF